MNPLLMGLAALAPLTTTASKVKEVANKRVEKNPTNGADIRIMHTGKVYPSQHFADKYGLEFTNRNSNTISNGVDLFRALDYKPYADTNSKPLLLGYVIRQNQPKVELFAGIRYDADGNPINSVMEQGSTLSEKTLDLIASGLGYTGTSTTDGTAVTSAWETMLETTGKRYVDLKFEDTEGFFTTPTGKYSIPKTMNKGEEKGTSTSVKRESINIMLVTEFTPNTVTTTQPQQGQEEYDEAHRAADFNQSVDTNDGGEKLTLAQDQAYAELNKDNEGEEVELTPQIELAASERM